ncbi:MAG TPA: class I SAM-dependent methyltransferase [Dehalococcoidales bacterium]|nr:class I SAM-dependent methyltransferase [Dehalococcoidales bacterium]
MGKKNKVQWIYSSKDNQELAERYDQWAKDYEADLERDFGWWGPQAAAEVFARYVPKAVRILDAGAGTGLVGAILSDMGYQDIAAMDLSEGMLEEARKKKVYREFHQMVMGEPLDFAASSFGAVVSVGVMTVGHAPASSLDELVRVTRPGGYIIFTLRPDVYESDGFKDKMVALESEGKWKFVEVSEKRQVLPKGEPDVYHQVWVYQVPPLTYSS